MSPEVKTISLEAAASEIHQACEGRSVPELRYFFLVGAGISNPPVKLSSEIIDDCREVAKKYNRSVEPTDKSTVNAYSHWFKQAYPGLEDRQDYLKELIRDKNISQANFRLAHLLLEKKITNLVVTTNFDDFLLRALTLFGKQPIVCDHPQTVERIVLSEFDDIQIIHVHGTYWFYDCINLKGELAARAQPSTQTTATMAATLDAILNSRVPLVIGYSGWEGDVVMSAIFRRLNGRRLRVPLYWFCYTREMVDSDLLPDWLKKHEDVYFVVPQPVKESATPHAEAPKGESGGRAQESLPASVAMKAASGTTSKEPTLDAKQVLDKLIQTFDLQSPSLTSDPLQFFADFLRRSLPKEDESEEAEEGDIYFIKSVIERIERAKQREEEEAVESRKREKKEAIESQLEKVRDALRRSQYSEAINIGREINLRDMTVSQQQTLMNAVKSAATAFSKDTDDKVRAYDFALEIGELILSRGVKKPKLLKQIADTLSNKGYALGEMNRPAEAIAAYDEVAQWVGDATEPGLRELAAMAAYNKGFELTKLDRKEEAVTSYEELVRQFGDSTVAYIRDLVGDALVEISFWSYELNRSEAGIAACEEVVKRFGDSTEPGLREIVAKALVNKGVLLSKLKKHEEAIIAEEEVVRRFGDATEPALCEQVAEALVNKGLYLTKLEKYEEAIAAFEEVVKRFGDSTEPALRELVAGAMNSIGFNLICSAKRIWRDGDERSAKAMLSEANEKIKSALGYSPQNAVVIGNEGYIAFLLGDKERARELLTRAISIGGEGVRQGELGDAEINALPQDKEFRELVLSIPAPAG